MTLDEIAGSAFSALGTKARIIHLPFVIADTGARLFKWVASSQAYGPFEFFLAAMRQDMVAPCYGTRHLSDYFKALSKQ